MAKTNPRASKPPRDADDLSQLPSALESAPGETKASKDDYEAFDLAPDLPVLATEMGGQLLGAAEAEAETGTPEEFLALSPQARFACRLRAGGMRVAKIGEIMRYHPGSIGNMLRHPLAKAYQKWLQSKMDDRLGDVQQGLQLLGLKALDRLTGIIHNSTNDALVSKCSFQLLDRIGFKPAEKVIVEDSRAITNEDIERVKGADGVLNHVLKKE